MVVCEHVLRNRDDVGALLEKYVGKPCDKIPAGAFMSPQNLLNQIVSRLSGASIDLQEFKALVDLKLGKLERDAAYHVVESTRAYIDSEIGAHTELVFIANNVLSKSSQFVESLFQFMNDTYESLVLSFKNPADTWNLVCSSAEQIFLSQFKGPLSSIIPQDFTDVKSTLLDTIWTTLCINVVVEDFLRIGLKDHHCLIGAANRFMIKQYMKS